MMDLFARLLMAVGGLGFLVIGVRTKEKFDLGIGGSFIGSALFGYLGKSNDVYVWLQIACSIALLYFVIAKSRASIRKIGRSGSQNQ